MRIILDECLPRRLAKDLSRFKVITVPQAGFAGYKNGQLLKAIESDYDVFITVDSNISYQQNLKGYDIGVIVLKCPTNRYDDLVFLVPDMIEAMENIVPGTMVIVQSKE